jgi:hypothetical protein
LIALAASSYKRAIAYLNHSKTPPPLPLSFPWKKKEKIYSSASVHKSSEEKHGQPKKFCSKLGLLLPRKGNIHSLNLLALLELILLSVFHTL